MQTFLPHPLFSESAKCLDNRRLGKQRVECLQILNTLKKGPLICCVCRDSAADCACPFDGPHNPLKTPWYNHPAVKMWAGFEKSLAIYGLYICNEWIKRGFKDSCFDKIHQYIPNYKFKEYNYIDYSGLTAKEYPCPEWLGNEKFHSSHRAALLSKNLDHYSKFGWTEPVLNATNYYWPK
jgi:hypothetical protein